MSLIIMVLQNLIKTSAIPSNTKGQHLSLARSNLTKQVPKVRFVRSQSKRGPSRENPTFLQMNLVSGLRG